MDFHELANIFPLIDGPELAELAADIKANGLIRPIMIFDDQILDGRNRFLACEKAGIPPKYTKFHGPYEAALRFVTSENLHRRHLDESQRAMVAARISNLKQGRPAAGTAENPQICGISQADAARQVKVSERSVQAASKVQSAAVPELVQAVDKGDVKVSTAAELTKLPPEKQREVVAGGKKAVSETVKELREARRPRREASPNEVNIKKGRDTQEAMGLLLQAVLGVRTAVESMQGESIAITAAVRDIAGEALTSLRASADWLETILNSDGVPDSVPTSWLEDGKSQ